MVANVTISVTPGFWEQVGAGAEFEVKLTALLDFVEILTSEEINYGVHNEPWVHGDQVFVG